MIKRAIKYLFPGLTLRQKLPLLPLRYSSDTGAMPPDEVRVIVDLLKGYAVARTDQDAMRILDLHRGKSIQEIIKQTRRDRKRVHPLKRAWIRLKARWS